MVIPNVCGISIYSPPLDTVGNSVRGIHLAEKIVKEFNLQNIKFDEISLNSFNCQGDFIQVIDALIEEDLFYIEDLYNHGKSIFGID